MTQNRLPKGFKQVGMDNAEKIMAKGLPFVDLPALAGWLESQMPAYD
ncbi:hypothetical protein ACSBLW_10400 [Thioclava sp. FR2]